MLTVLQTHPIQYQAPVYRHLQQKLNIPITVIYGSDFSVVGYHDAEFDVSFSWDSNLLSGYDSRFLTTVKNGGADSPQKLAGTGIADALADIRPTAVLLTGYGFPFHRAAFRQAKRCGYPLLLRGETTDADQSRGGIKKIIRDAVLRWYYSQFTALLPIGVNSNAHYDRLASANTPRFFSPYCIDTTPFATSEVDRAHYRGATRQRLNLKDDQQVILFSGKLIDKKAPELLLESIKRLPTEERKKRTILFLGDGPLRSVLAAMAEAEPTVHVHFLGFQNQSALSPYYHAADLLVLPSRYSETWGLVVNEALHHGLPCVVSDRVGCAPDLIDCGNTGEIFPHDDAEQLAAGIMRASEWIGTMCVRDTCREKVKKYTVEYAAVGIASAFDYCSKK